jgi:hypothetical protein
MDHLFSQCVHARQGLVPLLLGHGHCCRTGFWELQTGRVVASGT